MFSIERHTAVCQEFAVPGGEKSNEGYIVPNFELSPVSAPHVRPGPPSEQAQVISHFLSDLIKK